MFIPMNVEGGSWNEHFITTPKLVCITLILGSALLIFFSLREAYAPMSSYLILYAIWAVISLYVLRFIIFEEKFYYRMYKQLKSSEITTPSIFWDVASIKDTHNGALIQYSDSKIGIMAKVERDTITGKPNDFIEAHYDAISDFYKAIMLSKYNFVQMNIMEPAGNDPRLEELDKLVYSSDNPNIRLLMEQQVGHIKNITHNTLYESDYFLFYTSDLSRLDHIISDISEIMYRLMDGAYIGYRVLNSRDIIEIIKEEYGVKYFNYTEATLDMFSKRGMSTKKPFILTKICYTDGDIQELSSADINKIAKMTSDALSGAVDMSKISIKKTLYRDVNKGKKRVEFESLSEGFMSEPQASPEPSQVAPQASSQVHQVSQSGMDNINNSDDMWDIPFDEEYDEVIDI